MNKETQKQAGLKDFQGDLSGRLALVTGASRGIGREIALGLARRGANLLIHARDLTKLEEVAEEIKALGVSCLYQSLDLRNEEAVTACFQEMKEKNHKIDILVNNAGIYRTGPLLQHKTEDWKDTIDINLTGTFFYCRAVAEFMIEKQWGRIINISSISGKVAEIHAAAYSASKFAVIGLTQALALELASAGVTVNAVCPGWVDTELSRAQLTDADWCNLNSIKIEESVEIARLSIPQMRFTEASEVADLVCYLASNAASGITGQAINICGGMCLS